MPVTSKLGRGITASVFVVCTIVVYGALTLAAWVAVPSVVLGWDPHAIVSGSMKPGVAVGDIVLTAPASPDTTYDAGTVITFDDPAHPGSLTTHRVVGVEGDAYRTKGDANRDPDSSLVPRGNVRGVGRIIVPLIGLPVVWVQQGNPTAAAAVLLGLVAAFALTWWYEATQTADDDRDADEDDDAGGAMVPPAPRRIRAPEPAHVAAAAVLVLVAGVGTLGLRQGTSGATFTDASSPGGSSVTSGFWAVQVTANSTDSCGIRVDGSVWCWGRNDKGQLGNGGGGSSSLPVRVVGVGGSGWLGGVLRLAGGATGSHTCAVRVDTTVVCWGQGDKGQLGDGTTTDRSTPTTVTKAGGGALTGIVQVAPGKEHTCALTTTGAVWCWGRNDKGQLGQGTTTDSSVAVQVKNVGGTGTVASTSELYSAERLASGEKHSCVLRADTSVVCWGQGDKGQLGSGATGDQSLPVVVTTASGPLTGVRALGAGMKHSCAVTAAQLACWGENSDGQLGDGTTSARSFAAPVLTAGGPALTGAVEVHGGESHTCAHARAGVAWCWGRNDKGQLGNGTTTKSPNPVQVPGLTDVVDIAAAGKHACAVTRDHTTRCWGLNSDGQLGDSTTGDRKSPVTVLEPSDTFATVTAGVTNSCATDTAGAAWCWGRGKERPARQRHDHRLEPRRRRRRRRWQRDAHGRLGHRLGAVRLAHLRDPRRHDRRVLGPQHQGPDRQRHDHRRDVPRRRAPGSGHPAERDHRRRTRQGAHLRGRLRWRRVVLGPQRRGTARARGPPPTPCTPWPSSTSPASCRCRASRPIASGEKHTCAVKSDTSVACWGQGDEGQLGTGATADSCLPVVVSDGAGGTFTGAAAIGAGDKSTCVVTTGVRRRVLGPQRQGAARRRHHHRPQRPGHGRRRRREPVHGRGRGPRRRVPHVRPHDRGDRVVLGPQRQGPARQRHHDRLGEPGAGPGPHRCRRPRRRRQARLHRPQRRHRRLLGAQRRQATRRRDQHRPEHQPQQRLRRPDAGPSPPPAAEAALEHGPVRVERLAQVPLRRGGREVAAGALGDGAGGVGVAAEPTREPVGHVDGGEHRQDLLHQGQQRLALGEPSRPDVVEAGAPALPHRLGQPVQPRPVVHPDLVGSGERVAGDRRARQPGLGVLLGGVLHEPAVEDVGVVAGRRVGGVEVTTRVGDEGVSGVELAAVDGPDRVGRVADGVA